MTGSRSAKISAATAQLLTGRSATGRPGSGRPDMGSVSHLGTPGTGTGRAFRPTTGADGADGVGGVVVAGWCRRRWIFRPYERDRARGVVDDEPVGRAQALGPKPGT